MDIKATIEPASVEFVERVESFEAPRKQRRWRCRTKKVGLLLLPLRTIMVGATGVVSNEKYCRLGTPKVRTERTVFLNIESRAITHNFAVLKDRLELRPQGDEALNLWLIFIKGLAGRNAVHHPFFRVAKRSFCWNRPENSQLKKLDWTFSKHPYC